MESPESWIEDFGTRQLVDGKAEVRLDPDFAAVVQTDAYHVFLTGHDEQADALVVTSRGAGGFTVTERRGGTSSGTFSYRVVARPKTEQKVSRLEKFVPPDVKLPDVASLPKPVDLPTPPKVPDAPPPPQPPSRPTATAGVAPAASPAAAPQGGGTARATSSATTPVQPAPPPRS
jgi:hypothetical protein